jgi:hypothetical protein
MLNEGDSNPGQALNLGTGAELRVLNTSEVRGRAHD